MTLNPEDVGLVADVLTQAFEAVSSIDSPSTLALKSELKRRAREWADVVDAIKHLDGADYYVLTLSAVGPGMSLYNPTFDGDEWAFIVRTLNRDGQCSLHIEVAGRPVYINYAGMSSPVIVRS